MPRIIITEPGKNPQPYRFDLAMTKVKIGRHNENEIILKCDSASSFHAEMARVPGGFELRDLGSTNGIIKDDDRMEVWRLSDGDHLFLGNAEFDFQLNEDELTALAAEAGCAHDAEKTESEEVSEEESEEDETAPKPSIAAAFRRLFTGFRGIPNWAMVMVFLILGSIAFFFGMAKRHQNETGVTLGDTIIKKLSTPDMNRVKARVAEDSRPDPSSPAIPGDAEVSASLPVAEEAPVETDAFGLPADDPFATPAIKEDSITTDEDPFALPPTTTQQPGETKPDATEKKKTTEADSDGWDNWDDWDLQPDE